eukprot:11400753-Prorocentrum_lima.AAC.1
MQNKTSAGSPAVKLLIGNTLLQLFMKPLTGSPAVKMIHERTHWRPCREDALSQHSLAAPPGR